MKKSKIIIVLSLLVTSALFAATGTGAINVFSANRSSNIAVVNDSSAYLSIKSDSLFAKEDASGRLFLDYTSSNGNVIGAGINPQANTKVNDVFSVTNQSQTPVYVWLESSNWTSQLNAGLEYRINTTSEHATVTRTDEWFIGQDIGLNLLSGNCTQFKDGIGRAAYVYLPAGESFTVSMLFNTNLSNGYGDKGSNWNHTVTVKANSTKPIQPLQYNK